MAAKNEITRGKRNVDRVVIPSDTPPEEVEVLIVGAGPAGLGAAVEFDWHGLSTAVVEISTEATLARAGAYGHSSRTVEIFRRWGLLHRIREEWTIPPEWNKGNLLKTSLAGHELAGSTRRSFSKPVGTAEDSLRRPQTVLQKVFLERLAERGIPVSGGWRVETFTEDEAGVTTEVVSLASGERRSIRSKYLVGADGSKSTVRQLAGITRSGEYATERHYRFVVRTHGDTTAALGAFPSGTNIIFNNEYSGFLAALNETDWRAYAGPYPLDHIPTESELLAFARAAFGFDTELEIVTATPFFKSTRVADEFHRGRVLLVGDAAHVRTPGGNLGEGFGDIANLGWKLAAVIRGRGGEALLQSYDEERRPHNWRIGDHALARSQEGDRKLREIRELGVPADDDLSVEATERRDRIGEILVRDAKPSIGVYFDERYDASSVVWYDEGQFDSERPWSATAYEPSGRPGHRAPNGNLDPYGVTLYDRIGSDLALLVLSADRESVPAFESAAAERGIELEVIYLDDADARELYGQRYVLVRPDFHVAWRGAEITAAGAGTVLDHVYGRVAEIDQLDAETAIEASA